MRLNRYLSNCGIASRRKADDLILDGRIKVNGVKITEIGKTIDERNDEIFLDNKLIKPQKKRYVILNKPKLVITSLSDTEQNKPTIKPLISDIPERVYPVGRLDYDSEGLIFLTNDGELANRIHHPRFMVTKLYFVVVKGKIPTNFEKLLTNGLKLEDGFFKPDSVDILERAEFNAALNISFHEGKKHLVKRYFSSINLKVIKLKRIAIGNILLGGLEKGAWRDLSEKELNKLKELVEL
ncbi:MAG: pseudouridine synthase [Candidatus Dadabacteria bacterium]|nr:pseudouridine synthase [Candidatus Dadabacteria bacterium]NIQ14990.1 pseudouridine synthase [Candidatus Dadabacteria bacterium]